MNLVIGGVVLNVLLFAGFFYYYFNNQKTVGSAQRDELSVPGRKNIRYRIALFVPIDDVTSKKIVSGAREYLDEHATFIPEIKIFNANGSRTQMRANLEEALNQDYDLLITTDSQGSQMAKEVTQKRKKLIPIVFCATGDPIKLGLIESLERSGNHMTGACITGLDWIYQMIGLFPTLLPRVKKVLIPYNPTGLGGMLDAYKQEFDKALAQIGVAVASIKIYEVNDVMQKTVPLIDDCDMVLVLPDGTMYDAFPALVKLCNQREKGISVAQNLGLVHEGASMTFGNHVADLGRAAAKLVCKILGDGVKPTDIPIDSMETAYRVAVNKANSEKQNFMYAFDPVVLSLMEKAEIHES